MFRLFIAFVLVVTLVVLGATVKLGKRTFFGHIHAIWATPAAQDMKNGIEEKAKPAVQRVERGVKAGYHEATKDPGPGSAGSGSATPKPSHP